MGNGYRYTMVFASVVKNVLRSEMPADMRLEFLQRLDKMTDRWITPQVIAMIEPIDDDGLQLFNEAMKLGCKIVFEAGGRRPNAFDVLDKKFEVFAALNPSLQAAYDAAFGKYDRGLTQDVAS